MDENGGLAPLLAASFKEKPRDMAVVATSLYAAEHLYSCLLDYLEEDDIAYFPADELLRAEAITSGKEFLAQRLYAMNRVTRSKPKLLLTHPGAVLRYLPDPEVYREHSFSLRVGDTIDPRQLRSRLSALGYSKVDRIDQSLQYASRGDIVDFFSVTDKDPVRIEFFDDEIESIRRFDIATQTSKEKIDEVSVSPSTDMLLSEDEFSSFVDRLKRRVEGEASYMKEDLSDLFKANCLKAIDDFKDLKYSPKLYKYYGFAVNKPHSILDYFEPETILVIDRDRFKESVLNLTTDADRYYGEQRTRLLIPSGLSHYMDVERLLEKRPVVYTERFASSKEEKVLDLKPIVGAGSGLSAISGTIASYAENNKTLVLSLPTPHERDVVESLLNESNTFFRESKGLDVPDEPGVYITDFPLGSGFESRTLSLAFIASNELFGRRHAGKRVASRFKEATVLKSYEDLRPGDYVVHEYSGIGQFLGVETIEIEGKHRDYLKLAYADEGKLFVPLEQFRLVRKYAGREGAAPRLSNLYSGDWEKKKAKIEERINDLANRLFELYKDRARIEGYAFPEDNDLQKRFEAEFPYELTEDQKQSLEEIKKDMERPEVMDRLLCGDVGFGKTEVAFRAAYKAISSGKQVALLCPTTLLARQHYEVALNRFSGYVNEIAPLSRLVPAADQRKVITGLKDGSIKFVVGTHRLLSKEVEFKDLGLLIIDEEQRFGVEQKEKIKEMKHSVDVLSLSATPIPRTLQMSLVGIRPLSEINTPPVDRTAIETYVAPYNEDVAVELLSREFSRNGQAYYLHNNVSSIYNVAARLNKRLPSATFGVVHGQMEKSEIEEVMSDFYDGKIDCLVATSIIENGIDVPNANLLLVEDADRFGLSQLYQIKGRVGRGSRMAYAYLFYKPLKNMNQEAVKRLQAIQEFTELGSGYKIAQRDLLIRGAGDMLGPEQAGFIDSIGLDLYLKMLNEAVTEKTTGKKKEEPKPSKMFDIDAYIPPEFASDKERISLYQELEGCNSLRQVSSFVAKLKDVHGRLPKEVELLVEKKRIDILSSGPEYQSVVEEGPYINITMSNAFTDISGIGTDLFSAMVPYLSRVKVTYIEKKLRIAYRKGNDFMREIKSILGIITDLYESKKGKA